MPRLCSKPCKPRCRHADRWPRNPARASHRLGSRRRTRLRDRIGDRGSHRQRFSRIRRRGAAVRGTLRALASRHGPNRRGAVPSDAPGAVRGDGHGVSSAPGLPPETAGAGRHLGTAVRRAARKRHPRRPGPRTAPPGPGPHRRGLGTPATRRRCGAQRPCGRQIRGRQAHTH